MKLEFYIEKSNHGKVYEISQLVTAVSYTDKLNDGCSKLDFAYVNDDLIIENGDIVRFKYNNTGIFFGVVFKVERDKGAKISVTAYDQLRYCKAKDSFVYTGYTLTTLVNRMCTCYGLLKGTLTDTKYVLQTSVCDNQTWLDIIYSAIRETLQNTGRLYALRDEYGLISIRNVEDLKLNLVLGDYSLAYDFNYGKSIDDGFYNLIKIQGKKDSQFTEVKDIASINKYGLLQYFDIASEKMNASQIKAKADILLKTYNHEVETLDLECIGDTSIRAGSGFYAYIDSIKMNKMVYVKSVTHKYLPAHTMTVEAQL